ncbi:hypothetical protein E4O92_18885 [Massilia horti]|uniref:SMP-30/Gluconolactonase/LRE-like region domain-containing protein n=2 Tax=Massilia horti TaxID=2562153 RepID=A0A4Y9SVR4_9BURK|nr:hypothetical protein E4O92_18885 [Massilia horti]
MRSAVVVFLFSMLVACGGGSSRDAQAPATPNPPPVFKTELSLIAGNIGGPGDLDGIGMDARFYAPGRMAADMAGNLYVADRCTVRKIAPGAVVTTLAGNPNSCATRDGKGNTAGFGLINALGVAPDGAVYVAHSDSSGATIHSIIRRISKDGTVTTLAGMQSGMEPAAEFGYIAGLALDREGNIYVTDEKSPSTAIRKITPSGVVTTVANLAGTLFEHLAIDSAGDLFVQNWIRNEIIKIGRDGTQTIVPFPINTSQNESVVSFAVDAQNNLFALLVLSTTARIVKLETVTGSVSTIVQISGTTTDPLGALSDVKAIAIGSDGNVFVSASPRYVIRKITPEGTIATYAGAEAPSEPKDGIGSAASFGVPNLYAGIGSDAAGNLYVTDTASVRRISPSGNVVTIAGDTARNPTRAVINGKGIEARFSNPAGITIDMAGNVYVADGTYSFSLYPRPSSIDNASIRKISPTGEVGTFAGSVLSGYVDGNGEVARFFRPQGIVADRTGNLYVVDSGNCMIRKITPNGTVTTFAGMPCVSGQGASQDGVGTGARFAAPAGIAIDPSGNLYVTDFDADALSIRKITPTGVVSTLARGAYGNASDPGAPIQFGQFGSGNIAADAAGNIYLADTPNHSIRRIGQDGVVTTIVGSSASAGIRLGTSPSLYRPFSLAFLAPDVLAIRTETSVLKLTLTRQ